jgi:hypothetical protein
MTSPAPQLTTIHDGEHFRLELDATRSVIRLSRTPAPFESLGAVGAAQSAVLERLRILARRRLGLLVDLRDAPPRNDPEFERAIRGFRLAVFTLFARIAILVRTPTGAMQLTRLLRSDGRTPAVFHDEQRALDYLGPQAPEPGQGSADDHE